MGCLVSILAKFLGYIYLSLKCLIMAAKAHPSCPYRKGYKPQKKKLPENAKGKCLPLFNIHGFSEYYCGQIKIFRDLKARNYLSFYKKDSSESYWVKKNYRNLIYSRKTQEKKETGIKRTNLKMYNFRKI